MLGTALSITRSQITPNEGLIYSNRKFREWGGTREGLDHLVSFEDENADVTIDHDVWIGGNVSIRAGVHVGNGAVIASGAIVTKGVPPYSIVGGIPAKQIRMRLDEATVQALLEMEWWKYPPQQLVALSPDNPERFVQHFGQALAKGHLQEMPEDRRPIRAILRGLKL